LKKNKDVAKSKQIHKIDDDEEESEDEDEP